jgi:hypothetical protein
MRFRRPQRAAIGEPHFLSALQRSLKDLGERHGHGL